MRLFTVILTRLPMALLPLVLLSSCLNDEVENVPVATKGTETAIILEVPGTAEINTRAVGTNADNRIGNFTLFIFDPANDKLTAKVASSTITPETPGAVNGNRWRVNVQVPVGTYNLVAVANVSAASLTTLTPGMTEEEVMERLTFTTPAGTTWPLPSGVTSPIPMWGRLANKDITSGTLIFRMTRALAKINVSVTATARAKFTISSIRYYNYSTIGFVMPDHSDSDICTIAADGTATIKQPTTYGQSVGQQIGENSFLLYSGPSPTGSEDKIYVYEAPHADSIPAEAQWASNKKWINNPCLVIGGKYDGSSAETFYRVDFVERKTGSDDIWHSILRNNLYTVTINNVSGPGYEGADGYKTAYKSAPMNMDASTYVVNEGNNKAGIVTDGPYNLSVSETDIIIARSEVPVTGKTFTVTLKTNYPNGWEAACYTNPECTTKITDGWLQATPTANSGPTAGTSISLILSSDVPGSGYVKFTAGRMWVVVKVSCSIAMDFARSNVVVDNSTTGQPVNNRRLTFAITPEENHTVAAANAQGLIFRFGSLFGLNARNNYWSDATGSASNANVAFRPSEYTARTTWTWSFYQTGTGSSARIHDNTNNIPYCNGSANIATDHFNSVANGWGWPSARYDAPTGRGDICTYISDKAWVSGGNWRVPTQQELKWLWDETHVLSLSGSHGMGYGTYTYVSTTSNTLGHEPMPSGVWVGAGMRADEPLDAYDIKMPPKGVLFVPAGGYRGSPPSQPGVTPSYPGGRYVLGGETGFMWSCTSRAPSWISGGIDGVHALKANAMNNWSRNPGMWNPAASDNEFVRGDAMPIRCIRQ